MLFADIALAERIEAAECSLVTDSAAAIAKRVEADVFVREVGKGVVAYTGPGSPLNKLIGIGFGGPLYKAELEAIELEFARRAAPLQVEVSTLADPQVAARLTERGYVLRGFENVLGRALGAQDSNISRTEIAVSRADDERDEDWLDAIVTGFATPDTQGVAAHESFPRELLEQVFRDVGSAPGFLRWLAHLDGEVAGGGSSRLSGGIAQLCGAATLPRFRRRGVQGALLSSRLRHATDQGCDVAVITAMPGSKSQQNAQRQGFGLLYSRAVLVREFD